MEQALFEQIKSYGYQTVRIEQSDYLELVITKAHFAKLNETLINFFGEAAWPSQNPLTEQMCKLISSAGGLMPGQTFFYKCLNNEVFYAMPGLGQMGYI
ncbi:MAG: hypothetical protein N2606_00405 [Candidatus Omnitrophica bacterium]|nr:hypothetical protein [Candidatus Omnitrophota bacterium]